MPAGPRLTATEGDAILFSLFFFFRLEAEEKEKALRGGTW
jgi:hypothetical protein